MHRKLWPVLLAVSFSVTAMAGDLSATLPNPAAYPVTSVFNGRPAKPIISSKLSKLFRTKIREGAKEGPNFAGHFTVVTWGCGMDAYMFVVVDAKSGRIYEPPLGCMALAGGYGIPIPGIDRDTNPGYRLDSKLLLVVGVEDSADSSPDDREARVFLFDQGKFKSIYRAPAPLE